MVTTRLDKDDIVQAVSFPSIIDLVIYKDRKGRKYTLNAIQDGRSKSFAEVWAMATMMGQYAPDSIIGEVEFDTASYLGIRMGDTLYRFRKGVPKFCSPFSSQG